MTAINLKDAFFSVPVHNDHQKCLKFMFGNLFQFFISVSSMPYGYGLPMRIFTKLSKVPFAHLRSQGYKSLHTKLIYISKEMHMSCLNNILDTKKLLRELGFVTHSDKLLLTPSQTILFFRFIISSKHIDCLQLMKRKIR